MFRNWMTRLPCFAVAYDAPDTAGGGGGADLSGSGGDSTSPDSSAAADGDQGGDGAGADPATQSARTVDPDQELEALLDEEDDPNDVRPLDERLKAINATKNRLRKDLRKMLPLKKQLKEAGVDNVGSMIEKARALDRLQELADRDPAALRRLFGVDDAPASKAPSRAVPSRPEAGTDANGDLIPLDKVPFDVADGPVNQFLAMVVGKLNETHRELQAIKGQTQQSEEQRRAEAVQRFTSNWNAVTEAAAAKIENEGVRTIFKDAMILARGKKDRNGRLYNPAVIVQAYLTKLGVSAQTKQLAANAVRQRVAQNNTALPRQHAGSGQPATAKGNYRPTFAQIREKLDAAAD